MNVVAGKGQAPSSGHPLRFPLAIVRENPGLAASFILSSLGRAALAGAAMLLIREFLGGVLGRGSGMARTIADTYGATTALWVVAGALVLTQLVAAGLAYSAQVSQQGLVAAVELGTMDRLIGHLLGLSAGFFDRRTHGELIQTVRQDVSQLRAIAVAAATMTLDAMNAVGLMAAAAVLSPKLALLAFVLVPVAALPIYLVARRTLAHSFGVRRRGVMLFDMLLQLLRGIRIIKVYQGEQAEADRTSREAREYYHELMVMERTRALARVALETLAALSLVTVIIAGGVQVLNATLGWPELLAFLIAARAAQGPLNNVNTSFMEIQRYGASVAHIAALLAERPDVQDGPDAQPLANAPTRLSVQDVRFLRGDAVVLDGVSLDVRAGETLGIAGPSGAGKTTLLNLIARFYDPQHGTVSVDGRDLRGVRLADVYRQIAIVAQEPFLFAVSVGDNIRCGRAGATDAEVEAAARAAEIHDEIVAMPNGYATIVGPGGRELSRGEAQRVNIARAVLKNAPILLLDEATSSLDSFSEAKVQRAIDRLAAGRMTIAVAHRLSTLRAAHRVLVLEDGRVAGLGTHAELLASSAVYRRLWEAQATAAPTSGVASHGHDRGSPDGPNDGVRLANG
ncbi:MAG TPA: ABC transporter ATP-binding protein [Gemmatimonadaceae bacterium]|nr:ABC transporter ATP-binding protein [Gemmatimonadaceae bacterium]